MPVTQRTGSRIRDCRIDRGMKQTDLAAAVGISPSYLNLIEHNARRIGGRLLVALARALEVDAAQLTGEGERRSVTALRAAAADAADFGPEIAAGLLPELALAEDFADRYPGWAALIAAQALRIGRLGTQVTELSDRLTHDPGLATSLHQMITAVTAIRSTSAILLDEGDLDRDWRDRFHRNIHDDSVRLAEAGRALVRYLEAPDGSRATAQSPQDLVAVYLDAIGHHVPALETPDGDPDAVLAEAAERMPELAGPGARPVLRQWLLRYRADAASLPLDRFGPAALDAGHDPVRLARETGAPPATVMRRLATLPAAAGHPALGLVICDPAGAFLHVRRLGGFAPPRSGAGCPLWPLHAAFSQPGRGLAARVALPGLRETLFDVWAIAAPREGTEFDTLPLIDATMLVRPVPPDAPAAPARPVGQACRICPRDGCRARREASIIGLDRQR
jgi:hypothetical protein